MVTEVNTAYVVIGAYLIVGVALTYSILRIPGRRLRLRDIVLGAVAMPVLFVALLTFTAMEEFWRRLMIVLDYKPPENMRAGPETAPQKEADGI